jgi:hypothetical protein
MQLSRLQILLREIKLGASGTNPEAVPGPARGLVETKSTAARSTRRTLHVDVEAFRGRQRSDGKRHILRAVQNISTAVQYVLRAV